MLAIALLTACAPTPAEETPLPEETLGARATATVTLTAAPSLTPFVVAETATALPPTETFTASPIAPSATPAPSATSYIPRLTPTAPGQNLELSPTAMVSPTTTGPLSITFTADSQDVVPGAPVVLHWTSAASTASEVQIILYSEGMAMGNVQTWDNLPPNGSLETTIVGARERDRYMFALTISDPSLNQSGWTILRLRYPCPDTFFFDAGLIGQNGEPCPVSAPIYSPAVEQAFEGGRMLWLQSDNRIYVLYNNVNVGNGWPTVLQIFENVWEAGEPESDPTLTPPPGLAQPLRGFGAVWRGEAPVVLGWPGPIDVRQQLGWAVGAEQSFTSADQSQRFTCIPRGECGDIQPTRYLRLSDGQPILISTYANHGNVPFWRYLYLTP